MNPLKQLTDRAIRGIVKRAARARAQHELTTPKWHVQLELLRRAQQESAVT